MYTKLSVLSIASLEQRAAAKNIPADEYLLQLLAYEIAQQPAKLKNPQVQLKFILQRYGVEVPDESVLYNGLPALTNSSNSTSTECIAMVLKAMLQAANCEGFEYEYGTVKATSQGDLSNFAFAVKSGRVGGSFVVNSMML